MNKWDERYRSHDTVYGVKPNVFWASQLSLLPAGKLLLPCDGEGRNAVWAAEQGWDVSSFDMSETGVGKAQKLASSRGVSIEAVTANAMEVHHEASFDVVGLIFAHMPPDVRSAFHARAWSWVKPGGRLIVEGFHVDQLGLDSGGPKVRDMLFDATTMHKDLELDHGQILWNARCDEVLDEGPFHQGPAVTSQWVIEKEKAT
ncbi:MAG: class I SAM-dependent methyltransferase [Flavobacteriales bacterium]|nr:class I SAM-dependent methyltransferase [Flavobacteriales bacterium]